MPNKNDMYYNALSSLLTGQDIRNYLAGGGTLENLDRAKTNWDNWPDATAEFEAEKPKVEALTLFINHPY